MKQKLINRIFLNRNIASFYLVIMCIQIIPIEGDGVSNIKVGAMVIALLISLWKVPYFTKATKWTTLLMFVVLFSAIAWNNNYRSSTLIYLLLFLLMFNMYYGLVYKGAFSVNLFIRLIRGLIFAYIVVLVLQQIAILIGVHEMPLINMVYFLNRGIGANSLALEPSQAARIMAVAFYAFLKVSEIKRGNPLSIKQLFVENRWLTFGFLYAMISMGSATAFISLLVLSIYFMRPKYSLVVLPVILLLYFLLPQINFLPLDRARKAVELTAGNHASAIVTEDNSAASRILPILNTINNIDLSSTKTWFGQGSDTGNELSLYSKDRLIGNINDYGLISYIAGIFLIFSCVVTRFFSIETLLIFILVGFAVNNIAYVWGIYMMLVPIKYFNSKICH